MLGRFQCHRCWKPTVITRRAVFCSRGQREWALVIAGELLRSVSGRELALSLLAEMYPEGRANAQDPSAGSSPDSGGDVTLAGKEQGV